MAKQLFDDHAL